MDCCYLCGIDFNDSSTKKHDEHIIQQAIGGSLTAKDILCQKCGTKLGKEIDAPFTKIMDNIAVQLDIRKDRNNKKKKSIEGIYLAENIENQHGLYIGERDIIWKDGQVTPKKPFWKFSQDREKVIIYSNKKNANSYRKKVEVELRKNYNFSMLPKIEVCDDLEGEIAFEFKLDNKSFKRGLAKIAIGYASFFDIPREQLNSVLVLDNDSTASLRETILVTPFYPLNTLDTLIEDEKSEFIPYPIHIVTLLHCLLLKLEPSLLYVI